MQKPKIAVDVSSFMGWGGGKDFIYNQLQAIKQIKNIDIILLIKVPEYYTIKLLICKLLKLLRLNHNHKITLNTQINIKYIRNHFPALPLTQYKHNLKNFASRFLNKFDYILFVNLENLKSNIKNNYKLIQYIPDCQHIILPNFFSEEDINQRNKNFNDIIQNSDLVIVNSMQAKQDLIVYFRANPQQIINLPFAPVLQLIWLNDSLNYAFKKPYYLVSNQFWIHKDHKTVFKAIKILKNKNINIDVICTGETHDYRHPDLFKSLENLLKDLKIQSHVHILGYIEKSKQISLMKNAIAVIQPTLFEGGPGGGAVFDALSLGVRVIISDIEVNKEIPSSEQVIFFKTGSETDLAEKMETTEFLTIQKSSNEELILNSQTSINTLAAKYKSIFCE